MGSRGGNPREPIEGKATTLTGSHDKIILSLCDPFRVEPTLSYLFRRLHLRLPMVIACGDCTLPEGEPHKDVPSSLVLRR
jgi:hypothetical protein